MKTVIGAVLVLLFFVPTVSAQKLHVKVVQRKSNEHSYDYTAAYNLFGTMQLLGGDFRVSGATLTLQLPDGRFVVVNCKSKFAERFRGPIGNRRSCRVPLVNNLVANFHGDKAKLFWSVSLNGKKKRSETYKILAVIKPKNTPQK